MNSLITGLEEVQKQALRKQVTRTLRACSKMGAKQTSRCCNNCIVRWVGTGDRLEFLEQPSSDQGSCGASV